MLLTVTKSSSQCVLSQSFWERTAAAISGHENKKKRTVRALASLSHHDDLYTQLDAVRPYLASAPLKPATVDAVVTVYSPTHPQYTRTR